MSHRWLSVLPTSNLRKALINSFTACWAVYRALERSTWAEQLSGAREWRKKYEAKSAEWKVLSEKIEAKSAKRGLAWEWCPLLQRRGGLESLLPQNSGILNTLRMHFRLPKFELQNENPRCSRPSNLTFVSSYMCLYLMQWRYWMLVAMISCYLRWTNFKSTTTENLTQSDCTPCIHLTQWIPMHFLSQVSLARLKLSLCALLLDDMNSWLPVVVGTGIVFTAIIRASPNFMN